MHRATLLLLLLPAACSGPGKRPDRYSQAQLNAIETREVDASMDETYRAASGALFDAGYTILQSDRDAGLLTGEREVDRTAERIFISGWIKDTKYRMSIHVRETAPKRCDVRIKLSVNGQARVHKETVDEIWKLMQRQVLMKEPPEIDLTPGKQS